MTPIFGIRLSHDAILRICKIADKRKTSASEVARDILYDRLYTAKNRPTMRAAVMLADRKRQGAKIKAALPKELATWRDCK